MIASVVVVAPKAAHSNAIEQDQKTPLLFFSAIKSLARSLHETILLANQPRKTLHTHTQNPNPATPKS
jgi:hypothetical protein